MGKTESPRGASGGNALRIEPGPKMETILYRGNSECKYAEARRHGVEWDVSVRCMERAGVRGLQQARQVGPGQAEGLHMGPGALPREGCVEGGGKNVVLPTDCCSGKPGWLLTAPRSAACRAHILLPNCAFQLRIRLSLELI